MPDLLLWPLAVSLGIVSFWVGLKRPQWIEAILTRFTLPPAPYRLRSPYRWWWW